MGWRENQDALIAAGIGPEDADEPDYPEPTSISVYIFKPVPCGRYETGEIEMIDAPVGRVFPMFMERAAYRYVDYLERKHGKTNVYIEWD